MGFEFVILLLSLNVLVAMGVPQMSGNYQNVVDKFQIAVEQQTFQSILKSIEDRLRNLDNIYSMQLSETLKSKLDQYQRKLESLDTKIIRLESIVMLNLDRISENISTKNYKDDIARTQIYRKLDNNYDGLSHRISYLDRRFDIAFDKIQSKMDSTLSRLEKMEENMMQRNSDFETELAETFLVMEDLRSSSRNVEQSVTNLTNIINGPPSMQNLLREVNTSVSNRIEAVENKTYELLTLSKDTNKFLKEMKVELSDDFNDYANKVADMNMDIWQRTETAEQKLKSIETVSNASKIEIQNGVRALMVQIGKVSGKDISNNNGKSPTDLLQSINNSLTDILVNQESFYTSCHRVQMDESQIETEISALLEKLIDMLENKMTTVMKDIRNLEKAVKNHDSKTTKNIYQANTNIISLFGKTTQFSEATVKGIEEIKDSLNALFSFVQSALTKGKHDPANTEGLITGLSAKVSKIIQLINSSNVNNTEIWNQLAENMKENVETTKKIVDGITFLENTVKNRLGNTQNEILIKIESLTSNLKKIMNEQAVNLVENPETTNCSQNYGNLIDIRADGTACNQTRKTNETKIVTLNHDPQDDDILKQAVLNIFGTPPPKTSFKTLKPNKKKKKCDPDWISKMDIRADTNQNSVNCDDNNNKTGKKQRKVRVESRSFIEEEEEEALEEEQQGETDVNSTEVTTGDSTTTEDPRDITTPIVV